MPFVFDSRKNADKYRVKKEDTLARIVGQYAQKGKDYEGLTWQTLSLFNWGTDAPSEVNNRLSDTIGCKKVDADHPDQSVLDPHADLNGEILIPKVWKKKDLTLDERHVISVLPMRKPPAIRITKLDKWFIPEKETCELEYEIEESSAYADTVVMEVYGNKYCKATGWNNGLGTFAELPDTPVYQGVPEVRAAVDRGRHTVAGWNGKANAKDGLLKGKDRFINVVFSPYTVLFRYYRDDGDKKARITMTPFWPRFNMAAVPRPTAIAASLKIEWTVTGISRLKHGMVWVVDRDDKIVYKHPLGDGKLSAGTYHIDWDGKYNWDHDGNRSTTTGTVSPEHMPYRVQIQARTGTGDAKGVAMAAMHTEVRLYVHPRTKDASAENYDPATEPQTLAFEFADFLPDKTVAIRRDLEARKYSQIHLARGGYHPGPVDGNDRPAYQVALKEFKRSRSKRRPDATSPYVRFNPVNTAEDDDTLDALEDLPREYLPWFGYSEDGGLFGPKAFDALEKEKAIRLLNDPTRQIVTWVDDRQYNDQCDEADINNQAAAMGNPRGEMSIGDAKADRDAECIPRPWIPLQVCLPLMSREQGLDDELSTREAASQVVSHAVGPIRVDWTFDEIGPDISVIPEDYKHEDYRNKIRSRRFLQWTLDNKKEANYERKDLKRTVTYTNCPELHGGIRGAVADYYSKAFGTGNNSLSPWHAVTDAGVESVATVVHDFWGDNAVQSEAIQYEKVRGCAGVYFNPSNIAGDGYRIRARVRFRNGGGYTFPNQDALDKRYPKIPQANTGKMRLWRKGAYRGFVRWTRKETGNWPKKAGKDGVLKYYFPAHVHFVHEGGKPNKWKVDDLLDLKDNATVTRIKNIIRDKVSQDFLKDTSKMEINPHYIWPWIHQPCIGWVLPALQGTAADQLWARWLNKEVYGVWRDYRTAIIFELVKIIEEKHGVMKGHLLAEFDDTPGLWVSKYYCDTCGKVFYFLDRIKNGGDAVGRPCDDPAGCTGRMQLNAKGDDDTGYTGRYVCDTCHVERNVKKDNWRGNGHVGKTCGKGFFKKCAGTLRQAEGYREEYECSLCAKKILMDEPNQNGGTHVGEACPHYGTHVVAGKTVKDPCGGVLRRQAGDWERYVCSTAGCTQITEMPDGVLGHSSAVCSRCRKPLAHRSVANGGPDTFNKAGKLSLGPKIPRPTKKAGSFWELKGGLGVPAVGTLVGATWLFATGEPGVWAHEMGHHRHLQHAANAPGANEDQHDHRENPAITVGDVDEERHWDLHCVMNGYTTEDHPEDKFDVFCGKCLLKNRGWKVEGLTLPAQGVTD